MPRPCKILPDGGTPLPGDNLPNIAVGTGVGPSIATGSNAHARCPTPNTQTRVPTANGDTSGNTGALTTSDPSEVPSHRPNIPAVQYEIYSSASGFQVLDCHTRWRVFHGQKVHDDIGDTDSPPITPWRLLGVAWHVLGQGFGSSTCLRAVAHPACHAMALRCTLKLWPHLLNPLVKAVL